jgi:hypothetical protein
MKYGLRLQVVVRILMRFFKKGREGRLLSQFGLSQSLWNELSFDHLVNPLCYILEGFIPIRPFRDWFSLCWKQLKFTNYCAFPEDGA